MKMFNNIPAKTHNVKKSAIVIGLILVAGLGAYFLAGSNLFKGSVYTDQMNKLANVVKTYNYPNATFEQVGKFTTQPPEVGEESSWEVVGNAAGDGAIFASKKVDGNSTGTWRVLKAGMIAKAGTGKIIVESVTDGEESISSNGNGAEIVRRSIYLDGDKKVSYGQEDALPTVTDPYEISNLDSAQEYEVTVLIEDADGRLDWTSKRLTTETVIRDVVIPDRVIPDVVIPDIVIPDIVILDRVIPEEEEVVNVSADNLGCSLLSSTEVEPDLVRATFKGNFSGMVPDVNDDAWSVTWKGFDSATSLGNPTEGPDPKDGNVTFEFDRPAFGSSAKEYEAKVTVYHSDGTTQTATCSVEARPMDSRPDPKPVEISVNGEILGRVKDRLHTYGTYKGPLPYGTFSPKINSVIVDGTALQLKQYSILSAENYWAASYTDSTDKEIFPLDIVYGPYDSATGGNQSLDNQNITLTEDQVLIVFDEPNFDRNDIIGDISVDVIVSIDGQDNQKVTLNGKIKIGSDGIAIFQAQFFPVNIKGVEPIGVDKSLKFKFDAANSGASSVLHALQSSVFGATDAAGTVSYDAVFADQGASVFFKPNCNASGKDAVIKIFSSAAPTATEPDMVAFLTGKVTNAYETATATIDIGVSSSCTVTEVPTERVEPSFTASCSKGVYQQNGDIKWTISTESSNIPANGYIYFTEGGPNGGLDIANGPSSINEAFDVTVSVPGANLDTNENGDFIVTVTAYGDQDDIANTKIGEEDLACPVPDKPQGAVSCEVTPNENGSYTEKIKITTLENTNGIEIYDVKRPSFLFNSKGIADTLLVLGDFITMITTPDAALEPGQNYTVDINTETKEGHYLGFDDVSCNVPEEKEVQLSCIIRSTNDGKFEEVIGVDKTVNISSYKWTYPEDAPQNIDFSDIAPTEVPDVNGEKIREIFGQFGENTPDSYTVELEANNDTGQTFEEEVVCVIPKVELACEVSKDPIEGGQNDGMYSALLTPSTSGFKSATLQHLWGRSQPVAEERPIFPGAPAESTTFIAPADGFSIEYIKVNDDQSGEWVAEVQCEIPPKIVCTQDENGIATVTTVGIGPHNYEQRSQGYEWEFGDENPAYADGYFDSIPNYPDDSENTNDGIEGVSNQYEDTENHTVKLHMINSSREHTVLETVCPGANAPEIIANDDSATTKQGNPVLIYIPKNDTLNNLLFDLEATPHTNAIIVDKAKLPQPGDQAYDATAQYVTIEVLKGDPNFEADGITSFVSIEGNLQGVVYIPDPGFAGEDKFKYKLTDTETGISDIAIVTVTVNRVDPNGDLTCKIDEVDSNRAILTANFDRDGGFSANYFAVVGYQDGVIINVELVTRNEIDQFVNKEISYNHNSEKDFKAEMAIYPIPIDMLEQVPVDKDDDGVTDKDENGQEMFTVGMVNFKPNEDMLNFRYQAECDVPEDIPERPVNIPKFEKEPGNNNCSIINTNAIINSDGTDINQSEQSVDCSINISIDNSVTTIINNGGPGETIIIEKPGEPPAEEEKKTEIAAENGEADFLACYKEGTSKNFKDQDKFGYFEKFVDLFTGLDAVSPGDYQKGVTKLELTPKPIVKGYADDNFKVFNTATRTEGLKMIANATCLFQELDDNNILSLDEQGKLLASELYTDFGSDHWANGYAGVTSNKKVEMTKGYDDNKFRPEQCASKAEFAKILIARFCVQNEDSCDAALEKMKSVKSTDIFPDLSSDHWFFTEGYAQIGKELKITLGTEDGKFYPDVCTTRGNGLVLLYNYLVAQGKIDDDGNIVKIETKITR